MRRTVAWIVGEPGAGKTTLVRALLPPGCGLTDKPKWTLGPGVAAVGHYTGATFDGGDTVPYNGVRPYLEFWRDAIRARVQLTILDGDRFAQRPAVEFFAGAGVDLVCVYLTAPDAAARREARGTTQNATWVRGRVTKARNFADGFVTATGGAGRVLRLAADRPAEALAADVGAFLAGGSGTPTRP